MTAFWDGRYDRPDYLFGTDPAAFLTAHPGLVPPGARTLVVADGEGRNGVWLARQGCAVTAFDPSAVALRKARALADRAGVDLDLHQSDVDGWDWSGDYDLVVAVFIQFAPPDMRARLFAGMRAALRPGGRLMLHGYAPGQIALGTGGPGKVEHLYTPALLAESFSGFRILRLAEYEADLDEGTGHSGRSALVDLIADAP